MNNKGKVAPTTPSQAPGAAGSVSTGLPVPSGMPTPGTRPPGVLPSAQSQILHNQQDVSPTAHGTVGGKFQNSQSRGEGGARPIT